jgi:hypothetical protein
MNETTLIVIVALAQFGLHYFPWKLWCNGKELPRPIAYAFGVVGLMVPFTAWLIEQSEMSTAWMLWKVIVAGGMMVLALYGLDHYRLLMWKDREATEREALRDGDGS